MPWRSRHRSPRPTLSSRRRTTSNAACFSATKRTVLPAATALAMRFVIVCDLPVPGGPSMTNERPASAQLTACSWAPSMAIGQNAFASASPGTGSRSGDSANESVGVWTMCRTTGFCRNVSQFSERSCQSCSVENCSNERCALSSTENGSWASSSARRIACNEPARSMPESSLSGSRNCGIDSPCAMRSFSSRHWLGCGYPPSSIWIPKP